MSAPLSQTKHLPTLSSEPAWLLRSDKNHQEAEIFVLEKLHQQNAAFCFCLRSVVRSDTRSLGHSVTRLLGREDPTLLVTRTAWSEADSKRLFKLSLLNPGML